ncbi:hypothetical protein TUM20985_34610 [Mycobacterium antarcticum]|uniref:DUF3710 domain-containing protein n=1 Tax=unclassified Mycolicibacterium TaxID=2636767 RepID=UPI00239802E8|nr:MULTISPECIES: DUF3710 domain-containing protein [unclassified Mycolicibacterium]BDX32914.1 hypothetical protein TUM20985_34610 [Mycolicibacterium sp. TUM20985]GLP76092.1 hypothetical protein TUM20983_32020 [Mycolicibacterium sp. TUM20983]GLP83528.1 hypothetical protein TUM20984_49480 [Mycolicibacterium sp. TUM20984]
MAFGKRKNDTTGDAVTDPSPTEVQAAAVDSDDDEDEGDLVGPFDIEDFDDPSLAALGRHDLGAVLIPENEAAELAVEVNQQGVPTMAWMVTSNGRYNVTAYAAPKAGSLWREVVTEVAESLRKEAAEVAIVDGPWGREVVGHMTSGPEPVVMRFIGVDGYRWMVRGAAVGSPDSAEAIAQDLRNALSDTVVRRGDTPQPVRNMLPLQLSEQLIARLRARAEQMMAEHAQQAGQPVPPPAVEPQPVARRSEQGSAMQQLRTITGG